MKNKIQQPLPKTEEDKIAWTKRNFNEECVKHGKLLFPDTAPVEAQGKCSECLFDEKTEELKKKGLI
jgi:hypothetical protein